MFVVVFPIVLVVVAVIVFAITLRVAFRRRKAGQQIAKNRTITELPPSPDPTRRSPSGESPEDADVE